MTGETMTYIRVFWHHAFPDEPIVLYSEIDENLWEPRKVYVFRDGRFGYASDTEETNSVWLSIEPLAFLADIGSDPQFDPCEIEKQNLKRSGPRHIALPAKPPGGLSRRRSPLFQPKTKTPPGIGRRLDS
jgi:hypothetical protein